MSARRGRRRAILLTGAPVWAASRWFGRSRNRFHRQRHRSFPSGSGHGSGLGRLRRPPQPDLLLLFKIRLRVSHLSAECRVRLLSGWRSKLERSAATGWPHNVELAAGYVSGAHGWRLYCDNLGRWKGVQCVCSGVAAFGWTVSRIDLCGRDRAERSRQ